MYNVIVDYCVQSVHTVEMYMYNVNVIKSYNNNNNYISSMVQCGLVVLLSSRQVNGQGWSLTPRLGRTMAPTEELDISLANQSLVCVFGIILCLCF